MKQLNLQEKWALDSESFEKGARMRVSVPQCESCRHFQKGNALHCQRYTQERKPKDVLYARKECPAFESAAPLTLSPADESQERLYGGVFGFCIGDMLGVPVEFCSRPERERDPVRELRAYGTYRQPFGTWSDDSSLMFCLMDTVVNGGSSLYHLRDNFIAYYQDGRFTPDGVMFDIGISTRQAIQNMLAGTTPVMCGGDSESNNGNGGLMRILPLSFLCQGKTGEEICRAVSNVSSLTHRHRRSILSCIFYTVFAMRLFQGEDREAAYRFALAFVQRECTQVCREEKGEFSRIFDGTVLSAGRDRIRSTGYVVDTLEAALWALFQTDSYRACVLTAVNLGGDTDTIAALAGGLAGILYGVSSIPRPWLDMVRRKEEIAALIGSFAAATGETPNTKEAFWNKAELFPER